MTAGFECVGIGEARHIFSVCEYANKPNPKSLRERAAKSGERMKKKNERDFVVLAAIFKLF